MESAQQAPARPSRFVRLIVVLFRTVFITLLFGLLGMAIGLFLGIIITAVRHHPMSEAYRVVAIPLAITSGACAFVWQIVRAIRGGNNKVNNPTLNVNKRDV